MKLIPDPYLNRDVEATVCAAAADPAADLAYRAVAARRLTARAALSAALRGLQPSPAALS